MASVGQSPKSSIMDLEKQDSPVHEPQLEAIRTGQGHDLGKIESNKPLEQTVSHRNYSGFKWVLVCFAMYVSAFLYGLDNTIVADIQAPIIQTFGSIEKLGWLGIGFPLGSIASILAIGKAYGTFDVKWIYIISLIQFLAGSALCGGAPNMEAEIVGRVWAGFGGAGMYLGILNVLSLNTSPAERSIYISGCALIWGLGCVLGPVIGGSFADSSAGWRWAFYLNLVIFAVASPVILFVLESYNPDKERTFWQKFKQMDWVGIVLNAAMYATFIIGITFGGVQWEWSDGRTIAILVVFGVILIAFGVQQGLALFTTKENRIFPVDFIFNRDLVLQYISISASATGLFIPIYYIPIYFAFTRGDSAIDSAVRLLPFMIVAVTFFMLNGILIPRWGGLYAPWYLSGGVFMVAAGAALFSVLSHNPSNSTIYGLTVVAAVGTGLIGQAPYSVAQSKVPVNRIADAVGFINQAQIGAIAICLTITSSVFQNVGFKKITEAVAGTSYTAADVHAALAGTQSAIFETASEEVKAAVIAAIVSAISQGYVLLLTAGAVATVAALLMKWERIFNMETTAGG